MRDSIFHGVQTYFFHLTVTSGQAGFERSKACQTCLQEENVKCTNAPLAMIFPLSILWKQIIITSTCGQGDRRSCHECPVVSCIFFCLFFHTCGYSAEAPVQVHQPKSHWSILLLVAHLPVRTSLFNYSSIQRNFSAFVKGSTCRNILDKIK